MKWITREHIKVDRVACPWLIRHFIDPDAQFLFVDEDQLLESAAREDAIPFDAPHLPEVKLNHRGPRCSFEAIIEDYHLQAPGLARLALIVLDWCLLLVSRSAVLCRTGPSPRGPRSIDR